MVSLECSWGCVVVQTGHRSRRLTALQRAFGGVLYFCTVAMVLHSGFYLVARPVYVVAENASGVCGVGAEGWNRMVFYNPCLREAIKEH